MQAEIRTLVQAIHDSPFRTVLVTAGAGTQALADLLGVAGASRTLLEALIPYSNASFDDFLGQKPDQYVAQTTARLMAGRSLTRAQWLASEPWPCVGIGCTATIITDRPKRGEHRAHIATWHPNRLVSHELTLAKGARDRQGEEDMVSRIILNALADACGLGQPLHVPFIEADELVVVTSDFDAMAQQLHRGEIAYFGIHDHGRVRLTEAVPEVIMPGSFNPLHDGHLELAQVASETLGKPVAFELSASNVDKPPLPPETVIARVTQFAGRYPVYATNAPTFVEKARLFPGVTFVVGHDTAVRVLNPRYYGEDPNAMLSALREIQSLGGRFLVGGRVNRQGKFLEISDLAIPAELNGMFQGIPRDQFRKDISSTELRRTGQKGSR